MTTTSQSATKTKTGPNHIIEFAVFETPGLPPVPIVLTPKDDAWSGTLKKLAELHVNRWRSSYINPEIMDGCDWFLTVRSPELKKKSSGSNAYPPNFDEVRTLIEDTQMTTGDKINQLTLEILQQMIEPAVFLYLDKCLANEGDPGRPSDSILGDYYDEGMPHVLIEGVGSMRSVKLHAWREHFENMMSVTFTDNFVIPLEGMSKLEHLDFQGTIQDGPGKRILYEALGSRVFICSTGFPYDVFEPEILSGEGTSFTFYPQNIEIDFQSETPEELQNLLAKLEAAKVEVDKYLTLSTLKEDYTPFRSWV